MTTESPSENKIEHPRLKLHAKVWRVFLVALALNALHLWFWITLELNKTWVSAVLAPIVVLILVMRERAIRPPVLRFWVDGSSYRLRVRRPTTGAVLYQSEQDNLADADLRGVDFSGSHLQGVGAAGADFRDANLDGANLSGGDLGSADLRGATLRRARLHSTRLVGADLRGADLCGADLRRRDLLKSHSQDYLSAADFQGARYSASTRWPRDFDPVERGCVFVDAEPAGLPIPAPLPAPDARALPISSEGVSDEAGGARAHASSRDEQAVVGSSLRSGIGR